MTEDSRVLQRRIEELKRKLKVQLDTKSRIEIGQQLSYLEQKRASAMRPH